MEVVVVVVNIAQQANRQQSFFFHPTTLKGKDNNDISNRIDIPIWCVKERARQKRQRKSKTGIKKKVCTSVLSNNYCSLKPNSLIKFLSNAPLLTSGLGMDWWNERDFSKNPAHFPKCCSLFREIGFFSEGKEQSLEPKSQIRRKTSVVCPCLADKVNC